MDSTCAATPPYLLSGVAPFDNDLKQSSTGKRKRNSQTAVTAHQSSQAGQGSRMPTTAPATSSPLFSRSGSLKAEEIITSGDRVSVEDAPAPKRRRRNYNDLTIDMNIDKNPTGKRSTRASRTSNIARGTSSTPTPDHGTPGLVPTTSSQGTIIWLRGDSPPPAPVRKEDFQRSANAFPTSAPTGSPTGSPEPHAEHACTPSTSASTTASPSSTAPPSSSATSLSSVPDQGKSFPLPEAKQAESSLPPPAKSTRSATKSSSPGLLRPTDAPSSSPLQGTDPTSLPPPAAKRARKRKAAFAATTARIVTHDPVATTSSESSPSNPSPPHPVKQRGRKSNGLASVNTSTTTTSTSHISTAAPSAQTRETDPAPPTPAKQRGRKHKSPVSNTTTTTETTQLKSTETNQMDPTSPTVGQAGGRGQKSPSPDATTTTVITPPDSAATSFSGTPRADVSPPPATRSRKGQTPSPEPVTTTATTPLDSPTTFSPDTSQANTDFSPSSPTPKKRGRKPRTPALDTTTPPPLVNPTVMPSAENEFKFTCGSIKTGRSPGDLDDLLKYPKNDPAPPDVGLSYKRTGDIPPVGLADRLVEMMDKQQAKMMRHERAMLAAMGRGVVEEDDEDEGLVVQNRRVRKMKVRRKVA
ncbi:hypothetical protein M011DRAFT_16539 [Sporormia fimetaria CBS 119925]|uniref:Uncharacterized protein n=1 Tax=Sporormia fimetaria CBS 119925 TaxID=1340428 RepID=A0A6A6VNA5_9PLEO|nr:hypothetical protein M011DRAFT_16539 [Sporormia fimetaria CBS 119925]